MKESLREAKQNTELVIRAAMLEAGSCEQEIEAALEEEQAMIRSESKAQQEALRVSRLEKVTFCPHISFFLCF